MSKQKNKSKSTPKPKPASPKISEPTGYENGHGYVDLGLSVKWATCNVGANSPEEYGDYFAWGETTTKSTYDDSTYKWHNGKLNNYGYNIVTKYNRRPEYGVIDNKSVLESADDAAHVNMGGKWRMPTMNELDELKKKCTWIISSKNGVKGYIVKSKINQKTIFLPAAGYKLGNEYYSGWNVYLSSSLIIQQDGAGYDLPCGLRLDIDTKWPSAYCRNVARYEGQSIRAVCR